MEDRINYFKYWRPTILLVSGRMVKTREYDVEGGRFTIYYPSSENRHESPVRLVLGKNVVKRLWHDDGNMYLVLDVMVKMRKAKYLRNNPNELLEIRAIRPDDFAPKGIRYLVAVLGFPLSERIRFLPENHVVWDGVVDDWRYSVVVSPFGEETWVGHVYRDGVVNYPLWQGVYQRFFDD